MYIREHGDGIVFVPEDGVPDRDFVPLANVRQVDPIDRRKLTPTLPSHKRMSLLIREYLESRVGCVDANESRACRGFLKAYNDIGADRNEIGMELVVSRGERGAVQIFFNLHGTGRVTWMPVLVTAVNEKLAAVLRECGPSRLQYARDPMPPHGDRNVTFHPPSRRCYTVPLGSAARW